MAVATLSINDTVGQLVAQKPSRSRVFENLGIDYCCGGKKTLDQACREKNLDPKTVVAVLGAQDEAGESTAGVDAASMSLTELANHIEATHHAYLKTELPRLAYLSERVAKAHGPHDPRLVQLKEIVDAFAAELNSHMMKEERILFPAIRLLDQGSAKPVCHFGTLQNPINVMEDEHDRAGYALEQMRRLSDGFVPPASACNTYRALLDALRQLEQDMHQHVHKENNVLFPRATQKEQSLKQEAVTAE